MITKSAGLVLSHLNYGEASIIAKIYTREYGYQGFIVNSVRRYRSKTGIAYFQPFSNLELVIYMKDNRNLQRLSEFKLTNTPTNISIEKQTVLLFLSEVIEKLLRNDQTPNFGLFDFLSEAIHTFQKEISMPNFHLQLLLKISQFIGISIENTSELFRNMNRVLHEPELEKFMDQLISVNLTTVVNGSGEIRRQGLEVLIQYFQHHFDGFGKVHSLKVLSDIFK